MKKRIPILGSLVFGLMALCMSVLASADETPDVFVQLGHNAWVPSAALSPDGKTMASGAWGGEIKLWDAVSGKEIRTLKGHSFNVVSVAFSRDGKWLASLAVDNSCRIWEVQSGKQLQKIDTAFSPLAKTGFSSDGKYVWAKDNDGVVIAETATGRQVGSLISKRSEASVVAISPSGRYVLTQKQDFQTKHPVNLWDVFQNRMVKSFNKFNASWAAVAAISPDDRYFLAPSKDNTLELWELDAARLVRTFAGHPEVKDKESVESVLISPNGSYALSATKSMAKLWDFSSGRELGTFPIAKDFKPVEFSPDSNQVLLLNITGSPSVYRFVDSRTGYGIKEFTKDAMTKVLFTPVGKQVLETGVGVVTLWDLETNKEVRKFTGQGSSISVVAFAPDGKKIAAISGVGIVVWDITQAKVERIIKGPKGFADCIAFSKDSNWIIAGGQDKTVRLWELATGAETKSFVGHTGRVTSVVFSPDGRKVLSGSDDATVRVWDIKTGTEEKILAGHKVSVKHADSFTGVHSVDVSPDGKTAVSSGTDGAIIVWDLATGKQKSTLAQQPGDVTSVAFSADGKLIASGGDDGNVIIWELKTQKEQKRFSSKVVTHVEFSKDGQWLLSRSQEDESIRLWDVKSGNEIRSFVGEVTHLKPIYSNVSAAFSPNTRLVLTADSAGVIARLWDTRSGKELARMSSFADGEWIVITPEGYYNSSARGDTNLNVRIGNNIYGIENYREAFFRPDVVAVAIAGGSLQDFGNIADVKQPPKVSIVNTPVSIATEELTLTLKIDEQGGGIGDVRLYLNGTAVLSDRSRGIKVVGKADQAIYQKYTIKVTYGKNSIKALVFNANNTMQSNEARHEVLATLRSVTPPSLHALVVGINEFKNPKLKLSYSVADAQLFAATLQSASSGLYQKATIDQLLTPQETTQEAIIQKLKSYQSLTPDDVFVFYAASHGTVDDGEYYLITSNVGSTRTEKLKTDAINQSTLKELIANIPTTKKLIVLDTCNAGAMGDAIQVAMLTRGMSEDTAVKILSRAMGSTVLSASTSMQEALEGYNQHGLFTFVLAEGMQGKADKGNSGYIKTTDLADYVDSEVPALAEKIFHRMQYPTISISGQGFPIGKATPKTP